MVKSVLFSSIMMANSLTPIATDQAISNKLNEISLKNNDVVMNNDYLKKLNDYISNNKEEVNNIFENFVSELSTNDLSNINYQSLIDIQDQIVDLPSKRIWKEWWGVNLWYNFTKAETDLLLKTLYDYKKVWTDLDNFAYFLEQLSTNTGEIASGINPNPVGEFLSIVSALSYIGHISIKLFLKFIDYDYIKNIANEGNGVISVVYLFGVIPIGIKPGYKVI